MHVLAIPYQFCVNNFQYYLKFIRATSCFVVVSGNACLKLAMEILGICSYRCGNKMHVLIMTDILHYAIADNLT